jgi:hypothetical protein
MRLYFNSLSRPKRAAKELAEQVPFLPLSRAQEAIAYICGYESWAEMRTTSDDPATVASVDDEDLDATERDARHQFQVERVRTFFRATSAQAQAIVAAVAPGARARMSPGRKTPIGTSVYSPPPDIVLSPNYPALFGILYDVQQLDVEFLQNTEEGSAHLIAQMRVRFSSGKSLSVEGKYFWQFRDLIPPALADEKGDYLQLNPYAENPSDPGDSPERLAYRLRLAHDSLFVRQPAGRPIERPPLHVRFELDKGLVTTTRMPGLENKTREAFEHFLSSVAQARVASMQDTVDALMRSYLGQGYMLLEPRVLGGGFVGQDYVPHAWEGDERLPFRAFLQRFSPRQLHESGCGGNLTFGEVLAQDLLSKMVAPDVAETWLAQLKSEQLPLYQQICDDLGVSRRMSAARVAAALLDTREAKMLERYMTAPVVRAQRDRVLGDWVPKLSSRKPAPPPTRSLYGHAKAKGNHHD